jgi:recombinational DNA repair ATPase RecF
VKLRKLQLTDFRGARGAFDRKFKDKNYFIYAENGRGKSTIADAIEFSVNGDLDRFHREGCTLESAIHVDADEATVAVKLDDGRELTRTLKGASALGVLSAQTDRDGAQGNRLVPLAVSIRFI